MWMLTMHVYPADKSKKENVLSNGSCKHKNVLLQYGYIITDSWCSLLIYPLITSKLLSIKFNELIDSG